MNTESLGYSITSEYNIGDLIEVYHRNNPNCGIESQEDISCPPLGGFVINVVKNQGLITVKHDGFVRTYDVNNRGHFIFTKAFAHIGEGAIQCTKGIPPHLPKVVNSPEVKIPSPRVSTEKHSVRVRI